MCFTYFLLYLYHLIYLYVLMKILFSVNAGVSNMPGGGLLKKAVKKVRGLMTIFAQSDPMGSTSPPRAAPPAPSRRRRGRRPPSPPLVEEELEDMDVDEDEEEEDEEQVEEDVDVAEDGEEEEEHVEEKEEDDDDRIWEPPEVYVETVESMPSEPGTRTPYQRGVSELPTIDEWMATSGVVTLIPRGDGYLLSQSYVFTTFHHYLLISFLVVHCAGPSCTRKATNCVPTRASLDALLGSTRLGL
jgi:hypothetical protein